MYMAKQWHNIELCFSPWDKQISNDKRAKKRRDNEEERREDKAMSCVIELVAVAAAASYHETYGYHIISNELIQTKMRMTFPWTVYSHARINNCKKWASHAHKHKQKKNTQRIWLYCDVLVFMYALRSSGRGNRMEFIFIIHVENAFGLALSDIILYSFAVFAHFATIKCNKIKSNLCRAQCAATVHFIKSLLFFHIFHSISTSISSQLAEQHKLEEETERLQNVHFHSSYFSHLFQNRLAIGFHFQAFACGYFQHFSSLWWFQAPGDFYYIAHNSIHSKRCQLFLLLCERIDAHHSLISIGVSSIFSHYSFLKHNERTMAKSLVKWSIGMQ